MEWVMLRPRVIIMWSLIGMYVVRVVKIPEAVKPEGMVGVTLLMGRLAVGSAKRMLWT